MLRFIETPGGSGMAISIKRITAVIGAEVEGIDLNTELNEESAEEIYQHLLRHHVLVFRNQDLTPAAHVAFAESFGPLMPFHPFYPSIAGHAPIAVIEDNADSAPENEMWHSDMSATAEPPFGSVLRSRVIPPLGGDTLWCNMHAVYESLSPAMRRYLDGMMSAHELASAYSHLLGNHKLDSRAQVMHELKPEERRVLHPVVKAHPTTGRPLIYVNIAYTARIMDVSEQENRFILDTLYAATSSPRFQFRLRWTPNTVVVWDNYATQHFAVGDHFPQRRVMERVTILKDRRALASQQSMARVA